MNPESIVLTSVLLIVAIVEIKAHGMVIDPMHRGGVWRLGYDSPENYSDNEQFCGGFGKSDSEEFLRIDSARIVLFGGNLISDIFVQYGENNGKCGVCGDNYARRQPRDNENGGTYGNGIIVKTYKSGQEIDVTVTLSASHLGHFEFALCPLTDVHDVETDECFEQHLLRQPNGDTKFTVTEFHHGKNIRIPLQLPKGFTCQHCTLRWNYRGGNNWGLCDNGEDRLGCGNQEFFRSCSDIRIE